MKKIIIVGESGYVGSVIISYYLNKKFYLDGKNKFKFGNYLLKKNKLR